MDEQPAPASGAPDLERQRAFALLQPICSMLLLQRAEPQRMAELLSGEEWTGGSRLTGCISAEAGLQRAGGAVDARGRLHR